MGGGFRLPLKSGIGRAPGYRVIDTYIAIGLMMRYVPTHRDSTDLF